MWKNMSGLDNILIRKWPIMLLIVGMRKHLLLLGGLKLLDVLIGPPLILLIILLDRELNLWLPEGSNRLDNKIKLLLFSIGNSLAKSSKKIHKPLSLIYKI
jgi:hypothetical protein